MQATGILKCDCINPGLGKYGSKPYPFHLDPGHLFQELGVSFGISQLVPEIHLFDVLAYVELKCVEIICIHGQ